MGEKIYNKLVRDKIPDIIHKSGKECIVEQIEQEALEGFLKDKLREEVEEYIESGAIEELADIMEVIDGILAHRKIDIETLESIREQKKEERGGFLQGIKLVKTYEK
ncbi:putative house-cleaning noncanonical NTP pyrophosphatase (MazG superfamily) [Natranaerovirga hydrolytica]|uniref:Putative house-cleaning noncanonical NTP pyrophosphatase (MazG superfamily) n=1 Tax=Natranaerovirga hydrolytica TaxID=680378 RepID=A0A4R1MZ72_9FIRM|nr:nucleoside triphosphate pyrophosphohydrolase [Natranaerovirga hydrolytica]TCK98628.1 putative house-cleaning noncanonical NTP pyrophosphatase (MazG superfamily) [Natranaerovirga hydrolytica]